MDSVQNPGTQALVANPGRALRHPTQAPQTHEVMDKCVSDGAETRGQRNKVVQEGGARVIE